MNKINYLIVLFSLGILTACTQSNSTNAPIQPTTDQVTDSENQSTTPLPTDTQSNNDDLKPNQEFSLAVGEKVQFQPAGLAIEFVEVKSDSRCPSDVVCVWAGEATVHIQATTQGPAVDADLIIPGTTKNSIQLKGDVGSAYNLKLLDLKPYPNSKAASTDSQYKATFIFEAVK